MSFLLLCDFKIQSFKHSIDIKYYCYQECKKLIMKLTR